MSSAASSTSPKATPYNRVLIDRAERRLKRSASSRRSRITTEPGSARRRVIVVVQVVEEQPTGEFSFGGGYSTGDGVVGEMSLTERNFLGRGQNLRISVGVRPARAASNSGSPIPISSAAGSRRASTSIADVNEENSLPALRLRHDRRRLRLRLPDHRDFTVQTGYKIELQDISVDSDECDYGVPGARPSDDNV